MVDTSCLFVPATGCDNPCRSVVERRVDVVRSKCHSCRNIALHHVWIGRGRVFLFRQDFSLDYDGRGAWIVFLRRRLYHFPTGFSPPRKNARLKDYCTKCSTALRAVTFRVP